MIIINHFYILDLNFEIPQESVITDTITLLEENDSSLTDLNLNNHPLINSEHLEQIMEALKTNSCVENVSLVNVKMADKHAIVSYKAVTLIHIMVLTPHTQYLCCCAILLQ